MISFLWCAGVAYLPCVKGAWHWFSGLRRQFISFLRRIPTPSRHRLFCLASISFWHIWRAPRGVCRQDWRDEAAGLDLPAKQARAGRSVDIERRDIAFLFAQMVLRRVMQPSRRSQPPLALAVPLRGSTLRVGGGSACLVRQQTRSTTNNNTKGNI